MASTGGISVRIVIQGNSEITGFVAGAETPNDFWTTFKTQLVRIENAVELLPSGRKISHDVVYVNRDHIVLAGLQSEENEA